MTDRSARLAIGLRARRPEALAEIIDTYGREVKGVAYLIVRNEADAEEVAIDTFVSAWLKARTLRSADALRPWLLRIAARHSISRRRRAWRQIAEASPSVTLDTFRAVDERLDMASALGALPPRTRAAMPSATTRTSASRTWQPRSDEVKTRSRRRSRTVFALYGRSSSVKHRFVTAGGARMSLDMETRLRSVLEAEVAQIEVHFDADTVHERIAAHKAFRLAQVAGFVVAGVVATAAVMIVAVVSLRIDSDSASSPGGGSLPVGTFRTDRPFDGVCAAFHLNGRTAEVPAQWWTVGNTGECSTRDSTVQTATATVSELMVAISIPTVFGNQELLTYAVVELSDQILVASVESSAGSTTAAVRLIRVATVDPIIDPVICQPGGCPDHDSS